jgi:hypothetical protein
VTLQRRFPACAATILAAAALLLATGSAAAQQTTPPATAPGAGVGKLPPDAPIPPKLTMPKTPNEMRDAHIRMSIEAGVKYLKSIEKRNGVIGTDGRVFNHTYPVGPTALAVLAMIEAGVPATDPNLQAALKYVLETKTDHTYELALLAMVLARQPVDVANRSDRRAMELLLKRFVDWQATDGMWTYWLLDPRDVPQGERGGWGHLIGPTWRKEFLSGDRSNTQFAILALWEMSKRGVEIPKRTLRLAADQFLKTQTVSSGWSYVKNAKEYGHPEQSATMNATGLASLYILRDLLAETGEGVFDGAASPKCGQPGPMDDAIERAYQRVVRDLGINIGLLFLTGGEPFPRSGYYHYSIERVGVACGMKQLGDHDWYREGAWYFLRNQQPDGSWTSGYSPGIETAFALLFLAKGRAPFIMNKLCWRGDWNGHTRDLLNLTRYAQNTFEMLFRWQIVDIRGSVDDWLDAPVLYLTGHQKPAFTEEERKKLREFTGKGGVIFAEACCGSKDFDAGLRELAAQLFPEAALTELTSEHPIYSSHFQLKPVAGKPLLGIDVPLDKLTEAGRKLAAKEATSRTVLVYSPTAVGCAWNQDLRTGHERSFQIGINLFRYAMGNAPLKRPLDGVSKTIAAPVGPPPAQPRTGGQEPTLK